MQILLCILLFLFLPAHSLKCFQCESSSGDTRPFCSTSYFYQVNNSFRRSLITHCPKRRSAYCVILVENVNDTVQRTTRGCIPGYDQSGIGLNYGCIRTTIKSFCMCSTDLCNISAIVQPKFALFYVFVTSLFVSVL